MDPIAFYIFGISIRWYGIFIAIGVVSAATLAYYTCKFRNLNFDLLLDVVLISLPIGIIGARLYYVVFQFDYYKDDLIDILNIRQGGLAIHGGLIFGLLAAFITARRKKIDFLSMADVIAPSVIIAQALGRWGNFFNSEAHGGSVTYGFISHFPKFIQKGMYIEGSYYHPTFLYESIWNIVVSIILVALLRRNNKKGIVFFTYLGLYSLGRFFIEGLRTDSLMIGPIRTAQLMSLCGIIAWIVFLVLLRKRKVKTT